MPLPPDPDIDEGAGVATLIGRLVDDSRSLVSAEITLYRAKLSERIGAYRSAAIFFVVAGVLTLAALIALLVGLILALTPLVGPWFATLIVVGGVLVIALFLGLVGKAKLVAPGSVA